MILLDRACMLAIETSQSSMRSINGNRFHREEGLASLIQIQAGMVNSCCFLWHLRTCQGGKEDMLAGREHQ